MPENQTGNNALLRPSSSGKARPNNATTATTGLRALGFCGADDSVHPNMLGMICDSYPFVEFGVLFRPDKEGQPRYATEAWVNKLSMVASKSANKKMRLAAHLCGSRVNDILNGDDAFVSTLVRWGFRRVQINATAVNGVDTSNLGGSVATFAALVSRHLDVEFILQKNEETRPLWEGMLRNDEGQLCGPVGKLPPNVTVLLDESKGTGSLSSSWPRPPEEYNIGYAGGIGPANIDTVLAGVVEAAEGRTIWIDMESSLRSTKNGMDVFDLDKCYQCIEAVCAAGLHEHPSYLP